MCMDLVRAGASPYLNSKPQRLPFSVTRRSSCEQSFGEESITPLIFAEWIDLQVSKASRRFGSNTGGGAL